MPAETAGTAAETQVVVFQVAGELYGVNIHLVREVVPAASYRVTPVPRTPSSLSGIINLRGRVVPVVDLRVRLGLPVRPVDRETRIAVAETPRGPVGMVVDGVSEVLRLSAHDVSPPAGLTAGTDAEAVKGVAQVRGRLITLLDLERVLVPAGRAARVEGDRHGAEL